MTVLLATRTGENQHMPVTAFMSIRVAARCQPANRFALQEFRFGRNLRDGSLIDTDVGKGQFTDVLHARINHFTDLGKGQRNRHLSLDGDAERYALVGIEP